MVATYEPGLVHIVIRSTGERTAGLCRELLCRQVAEAAVTIVEEAPFSRALAKCYEIGLAQNCRWTMCIDADIIPVATAVRDMVAIMEGAQETMFEAQGLVWDKVFGLYRPAGNHIYRTALLGRALDILDAKASQMRPESAVVQAMRADGFGWYQADTMIGLHDDGQFHHDLARKVCLQMLKFRTFRDEIRARFKGGHDPDFKTLALASDFAISQLNDSDAHLHRDWLRPQLADLLKTEGIVEKGHLDETEAARLIAAAAERAATCQPYRLDERFIGPIGPR